MSNFLKLFFGLLVVVAIIAAGALFFESFITEEELTIKIELVDKVVTKDNETYYLVYTKDEVFENRNNYFHKKENAESLNQKIKEGQKYRVRVVGYSWGIKLPFFTEHRNIIDIVEEDDLLKSRTRF